jgi:hypothetical protein
MRTYRPRIRGYKKPVDKEVNQMALKIYKTMTYPQIYSLIRLLQFIVDMKFDFWDDGMEVKN